MLRKLILFLGTQRKKCCENAKTLIIMIIQFNSTRHFVHVNAFAAILTPARKEENFTSCLFEPSTAFIYIWTCHSGKHDRKKALFTLPLSVEHTITGLLNMTFRTGFARRAKWKKKNNILFLFYIVKISCVAILTARMKFIFIHRVHHVHEDDVRSAPNLMDRFQFLVLRFPRIHFFGFFRGKIRIILGTKRKVQYRLKKSKSVNCMHTHSTFAVLLLEIRNYGKISFVFSFRFPPPLRNGK